MPFFAWLMFRLTSHWKQFRISGSSRIGNDLPVQAHPALDNSVGCVGQAHCGDIRRHRVRSPPRRVAPRQCHNGSDCYPMPELVQYTVQDDVAIVTINNPPVNALSPGVPEGIDTRSEEHTSELQSR